MRRTGVALLLVAAALPASGHEVDPGVTAVLDAVDPPLPGVTVEVRRSAADQLVVANPTPTDLTVLGEAGEPFLRIGPDGAYANTGSPTWHRSNSPGGAAGTAGPERFVRVSREPAWGWFEHRMHATRLTGPRGRGEVTRLGEWRVPFRYGDRTGEFRGHVEFRPVLGTFRAYVTAKPPDLDVQVLQGRVPGLTLLYEGDRSLLVLGAAGEPVARMSRDRAEVNLASPTYAEHLRMAGTPGDVEADAGAEPVWRRAGFLVTLLDRRLAYPAPEPPPERRGERAALVHWRIPLKAGGDDAAIEGVTEWVPVSRPAREPSRLPWLLGGGAVAVLAAAVVARRRAR